jgi:hypothetical protein
MERSVSESDARSAWRRVVAAYAGRFTAEYRAEPDRLRDEAISLLRRLSLVSSRPEGGLTIFAALARYRASAELPEPFDV